MTKEKIFKKKENKRLLIIFIILLSLSIGIEVYLKVKKDDITYLKNIEEYKNININEVKNIEVVKLNSGEDLRNIIDKKDDINKIYESLGNIKIGSKIDYQKESNSIFYIFSYKDDSTYTFSFYDDNIFLNEEYYITTGLDKVKG